MTPSRLLILSKPSRPPASVLSLFSAGEPGDVWIPSLRTMYQDAAMTIPAVPGMPVVKAVGSIRSTVFTLTNVTLQQDDAGCKYLAANGTDSSGVTASIDFSGTDKMTVIAGVYKASDAAAGALLDLTNAPNTTNGSFTLLAPSSAAPSFGWYSRGTAQQGVAPGGNAAPMRAILTGEGDIAGDVARLRVNGTATATAADQGTGNYANAPLYLFRRGGSSFPFSGRLYGLIVRGAASTAGQIADAERYMARLTGVNI